ncbi:hypothetical protein POSPLADRAFT_1141752 [Postia placenta MAD-698-R-SB12]|uniref:Uncharacterized protein n=1 Tax=Postia placenta MAD-698-R-SB12 TaxID=670580 RepID=A0A1X6N3I8_9APHY|nr:hypothetical protein POSPLADRAFT_1141752 [Postia placenta MAD-698-R-SB12]OSX63003.1 hypothetical protein POSPLADRAFT_1141752 [Postia placenta MAD-698-R-SB12]
MSQLAQIKKLGREGTINMQASLSPSSSGRDATDRRNRREVDRKFLRGLNKDQVKSYAIAHGVDPHLTQEQIINSIFANKRVVPLLPMKKMVRRRVIEGLTYEEVQRYAKALKVDPELPKEEIINRLYKDRDLIPWFRVGRSFRGPTLEGPIIKQVLPGCDVLIQEKAHNAGYNPHKRHIVEHERMYGEDPLPPGAPTPPASPSPESQTVLPGGQSEHSLSIPFNTHRKGLPSRKRPANMLEEGVVAGSSGQQSTIVPTSASLGDTGSNTPPYKKRRRATSHTVSECVTTDDDDDELYYDSDIYGSALSEAENENNCGPSNSRGNQRHGEDDGSTDRDGGNDGGPPTSQAC